MTKLAAMLALPDRSVIDVEFRARRSIGRCLAEISVAVSRPFARFLAAIEVLPVWARTPLAVLCMGVWWLLFMAVLYGSFVPILLWMASPNPSWEALAAAAWAVWISALFTLASQHPVGLFWLEDRLYNHAMRHAARHWNQPKSPQDDRPPPASSPRGNVRILAAPPPKPDTDLP